MKKGVSFLQRPGTVFFAVAVAFALIVLCFFQFRTQVNSYIDRDMRSQMEAIQVNSILLIQNEMNYLKRLTASAALILGRAELGTDEEILRALEDYSDAANVVRSLFVTLDGRVYTNYAGYLGQSDENTSIDGIPLSEITAPIFSQAYYAEELDEVVFGVIAPAAMGKKQGVLVSSYNISEFSALLENKFIGGSAEIGILNSRGEVISGIDADQFRLDVFDSLSGVEFRDSSVDAMRADFANGSSGFSIYRVGGIARYCTYAPVGLNDWYIVAVVKESSLRGRLINLERHGFQLTVELVIIMLALLCVIIANRVEEQKKIRGILERAARMDGLTGIYNRKAVEETIDECLRSAGEGSRAALLVIDLDDFKTINDQGGHLFGDNVLKDCAGRLERIFGEDGVVGRVGGDEFVVFLRDARDTGQIEEKVNALIRDFYVPTDRGELQKISVSVGIAKTGPQAESFLELYQWADAALYRAKHMGKARLSS